MAYISSLDVVIKISNEVVKKGHLIDKWHEQGVRYEAGHVLRS